MGQKQGAGARPLFRRYPLAWRRAQRPHPPASSPGSRARPGAGTDAVGVMHAQGLFQTIHVHPVVLVSRSRAHAIARRRHPEGCAKGRVHRALHFPPALRHPAIAKLNSTDAHELPQAGIVAVPPQVGGEAADADPARLPPLPPRMYSTPGASRSGESRKPPAPAARACAGSRGERQQRRKTHRGRLKYSDRRPRSRWFGRPRSRRVLFRG